MLRDPRRTPGRQQAQPHRVPRRSTYSPSLEQLEGRSLLASGSVLAPDAIWLAGSGAAAFEPGVSLQGEFPLDSRWTATALDGGGLERGDPVTLTWTIVADGTPISPSGSIPGESKDGSSLVSFLDQLY